MKVPLDSSVGEAKVPYLDYRPHRIKARAPLSGMDPPRESFPCWQSSRAAGTLVQNATDPVWIQAIWGRLASVDVSERDRLAARPLALQRSKLFDQQAEAYDRVRPTYPDAVIDELLGPVPAGLDVLDVGCGTGIASRQIAQRGAKVLGVELAPRMAEIARGHGVDVETAAFEAWGAAGRTFDRVTSAQAWHWLDLPMATAKAASVLRPGGKLCLIWNAGCQPDDLADALEEVYARIVPPGGHLVFRGTRPAGHPT